MRALFLFICVLCLSALLVASPVCGQPRLWVGCGQPRLWLSCRSAVGSYGGDGAWLPWGWRRRCG